MCAPNQLSSLNILFSLVLAREHVINKNSVQSNRESCVFSESTSTKIDVFVCVCVCNFLLGLTSIYSSFPLCSLCQAGWYGWLVICGESKQIRWFWNLIQTVWLLLILNWILTRNLMGLHEFRLFCWTECVYVCIRGHSIDWK